MKVTMLRLMNGCYALKGATNFVDDPRTKIDMVGGGNFVVHQGGKSVFLPSHRVDFAEITAENEKKTKPAI